MKIKNIVVEILFPAKETHNHSLKEFYISASDTYPKLRAYIDNCVNKGKGHHNTFIQVRKYAREELVPGIEKDLCKKIGFGDTRFYPSEAKGVCLLALCFWCVG